MLNVILRKVNLSTDCNWTRTDNHLVYKRTLNHWQNWPNNWAVLWLLICTVHLTVYSYHVMYAFQSESILWNECRMWSVDSIECGFTLERVRGMIRTYSQMHRTDKYSQHSSVIWPVWLNGWVFVYELSGCEFESSCSHWNFRFRACFQQGVPWHSENYRVWIHYEMHMWHDKNIQSVKYRFCT